MLPGERVNECDGRTDVRRAARHRTRGGRSSCKHQLRRTARGARATSRAARARRCAIGIVSSSSQSPRLRCPGKTSTSMLVDDVRDGVGQIEEIADRPRPTPAMSASLRPVGSLDEGCEPAGRRDVLAVAEPDGERAGEEECAERDEEPGGAHVTRALEHRSRRARAAPRSRRSREADNEQTAGPEAPPLHQGACGGRALLRQASPPPPPVVVGAGAGVVVWPTGAVADSGTDSDVFMPCAAWPGTGHHSV